MRNFKKGVWEIQLAPLLKGKERASTYTGKIKAYGHEAQKHLANCKLPWVGLLWCTSLRASKVFCFLFWHGLHKFKYNQAKARISVHLQWSFQSDAEKCFNWCLLQVITITQKMKGWWFKFAQIWITWMNYNKPHDLNTPLFVPTTDFGIHRHPTSRMSLIKVANRQFLHSRHHLAHMINFQVDLGCPDFMLPYFCSSTLPMM